MKTFVIIVAIIISLFLYICILVPDERDKVPKEAMKKYTIDEVVVDDNELKLVVYDAKQSIPKLLDFQDSLYKKEVHCKIDDVSDYKGKVIYYRDHWLRTGIRYIIEEE